MKFRYTIEELKTYSDAKMCLCLVNERISDLNRYSPLGKRLWKLKNKLECDIEEEKNNG